VKVWRARFWGRGKRCGVEAMKSDDRDFCRCI
jgi:hypothetical protein